MRGRAVVAVGVAALLVVGLALWATRGDRTSEVERTSAGPATPPGSVEVGPGLAPAVPAPTDPPATVPTPVPPGPKSREPGRRRYAVLEIEVLDRLGRA